MSVHVEFNAGVVDGDPSAEFLDSTLPAGSGVYCYQVGAGGELILLVDEHGESRIDRVYGPTAWKCVRGDVWRKGSLLQG
jgi:hypothetical protein